MTWEHIATATTAVQAHIWRSHLEAEGIAAQVVDKTNGIFGMLAGNSLDPAQVCQLWVPLADAHKALDILFKASDPANA